MKSKLISLVLLLILTLSGCQEEFVPVIRDFESVLVVESTISDSLETQSVKLSRTIPLDEEGVLLEDSAEVTVAASTGETYQFSQAADGVYYSNIPFSAEAEVSYTLIIETSDGMVYNSSEVSLPEAAAFTNLYAERVTKNGVDGVQIYADSRGGTDNGSYFRYQYEETYQIAPPYFTGFKTVLDSIKRNGEEFDIVMKELENDEGRFCYSSNFSQGVNQVTTSNLSENSAEAVPIRFIPANDPIIRERYSIQVSQYVETPEAYAFYKILKDLGNSESILSQNLPGTIQGNIFNVADDEDLVIGYFGVAIKESKRIFFDYSDFEIPLPPYFYECEEITLDYLDNIHPMYDGDANDRQALFLALENGKFEVIPEPMEVDSLYVIVRSECVNCATFSSQNKPDFWID